MSLAATLLYTSLLMPTADALEGTWKIEQVLIDGRAQAPQKTPDVAWTFTADTLTVLTAGKPGTPTKYTAEAAAKPATIDLTVEGKETIGIYEVTDGILRVAVPAAAHASDTSGANKRGFKRDLENVDETDPEALAPERPVGFGKNNERVTVYVLSRVVAGQTTLAPIIKRPPPALPTPPKGNAAPSEQEKEQWPKVWRGRYFLPASK